MGIFILLCVIILTIIVGLYVLFSLKNNSVKNIMDKITLEKTNKEGEANLLLNDEITDIKVIYFTKGGMDKIRNL